MSSLSRLQRRRLATATDEADKMVQADERYFERFPDRNHRVRLASKAEMEANFIVGGYEHPPTLPGQRWYCAVKQIGPGVRSRVFLQNDPDVETEMPEWQAAHVYDLVATPGSHAYFVEQQLRAAVAKRGGRL